MRDVFDVDCVVVGAGVVGLAVARELARGGREVVVLEAAGREGTGTSSRNSEVIHAGIYYRAGSAKARLCVTGRERLYAYCRERGIPHRRTGKLIVATDAGQRETLASIAARAAANGVGDLVELDRAGVAALEPALAVAGALHSPSTGIVDSHALMRSLLGEAEDAGAALAVRSRVAAIEPQADGRLRVVGVTGDEPGTDLLARTVVNAAGLDACAVAARVAGLDPAHVPTPRYARGCYFALAGRTPFTRLIYPVPEPGGLGVHLTLDLEGRARFGPDVEWIEHVDYAVDPARAERFERGVRAWWPDLPEGSLVPDYAGVRPKIERDGELVDDFLVEGPATHGVAGLVNLFGIESPGLTASLAIAADVATLVAETR